MIEVKNGGFFLAVAFLLSSLAIQAEIKTDSSQGQSNFIIMLPTDEATPQLSDDELWQRAAVVRFSVGSAYIPYSDPGFRKVVKAVEKITDSCVVNRLMIIRGGASPEGGYQNNSRLAHLRARALVKVLSKYISLPDSLVEEKCLKEDYIGLQRLLAEKPMPYSKKVSSVIEQNKGNAAKTKLALQRLDGGKAWHRLLRDYFPELRTSRLVLFISKKDRLPRVQTSCAQEEKEDSLVAEVPQDMFSNGKDSICMKADTLTMDSGNKAEFPLSGHPCLNVKTNILYDLALFIPQYGYAPTPNISLEYLPKSGHITPVVELIWTPWRNDKRSKTWIIHNLLLEGRYYLKNGGLYIGHYVSAYANVGAYDIQFNENKAWLSDKWSKNYGFGIGWGYVRRFQENSRWKWEVNAALGYLRSSYDGYHNAESWAEKDKNYFDWHENPSDYRRYQNHLNYWGLTRLGFSISYDLF